MFIELTEYLRCAGGHGDEYLVLTPDKMVERTVVFGTLGCPICKREFRIENKVAIFGEAESVPASTIDLPAGNVHALLNLSGPGGYVALVGSGATLAPSLSDLFEDVHLIGVNAPASVTPTDAMSLVTGELVPLRSQVARGVVLGAEQKTAQIEDAARVLLKGLRMVVLAERAELPDGIKLLAAGNGLTVGERT
jgi:hypothetical protein